jgi:hypothetical protein
MKSGRMELIVQEKEKEGLLGVLAKRGIIFRIN